jgi:hypothetical protein
MLNNVFTTLIIDTNEGINQCCAGSKRFLLPSSLIKHVSVLTQFSGYEQVHLILNVTASIF